MLLSNNQSLLCLLGTVRRFLEAYPEFRVVLCVEKAERAVYNALAPLYFPASKAEEEAATWHLPTDIGGPLGEPSDPERQIRIIQNPRHDDAMNGGKYKYVRGESGAGSCIVIDALWNCKHGTVVIDNAADRVGRLITAHHVKTTGK